MNDADALSDLDNHSRHCVMLDLLNDAVAGDV
jgi:hypothetical protein